MPRDAAILVVDDDPGIRAVLQAALGDEGYSVELAMHGQAALTVMADRHPRLILLDMQMPVMDGPEFCRELEAQHLRAETTVVVMTASDKAQHFKAVCKADDILGKPFDLNDVYALVERYV